MASASKLARSFLHLLDGCEAAKIFQYLSAKPHQPRWWPCYIATQDILNAFRCGGIIRDAAVTAQAQVELLESHQAHAVSAAAFIFEHHHLSEVLTQVGGRLKELFVTSTHTAAEDEMLFRPWVNALASHCTGLQRLDISNLTNAPLEEAILSSSRSVQDLAVNPAHAPLIGSRFAGLRRLLLTAPPQDAEEMWRAVGSSLELVSIGHEHDPAYVDRETIRNIQSHCRKLSSLRLYPTEEDYDVCTELLMSYGSSSKI